MLFATIAQRNRYAKAVLALSPSAYWRLAEPSGTVAKDVMGSYDGSMIGSVGLGTAGAIAGNSAITLDTAGERIDTAWGMTFDASVSVSAWVNPRAVEDLVRYIFVGHNSGSSAIQGPLLLLAGNTLTGGAPNNAIRFQVGQNVGTYRTTSTAVSASAWSHIVATYATGGLASPTTAIKIYVNGAEASYFDSSAAGTTGQTYNASIGGRRTDNLRQLYGSLDEISIHPSTLTVAQVLSLYQSR